VKHEGEFESHVVDKEEDSAMLDFIVSIRLGGDADPLARRRESLRILKEAGEVKTSLLAYLEELKRSRFHAG
jgi:hypothetical protein